VRGVLGPAAGVAMRYKKIDVSRADGSGVRCTRGIRQAPCSLGDVSKNVLAPNLLTSSARWQRPRNSITTLLVVSFLLYLILLPYFLLSCEKGKHILFSLLTLTKSNY
jgi:hypothetical protein